jgi:hypothetical protein
MSNDPLQTAINQLSLVMNVAEDIAKACKKAEIHPDLARVLMKMHTTQMEMEKELNETRKTMMLMAQTLNTSAGIQASTMFAIEAFAKRQGITPEELFKPDDEGTH